MRDDILFIAASLEDFPYFYGLRRRTMREHFLNAGKVWDDTGERTNHKRSFDPESLRMIYFRNQRVGFVDVCPRGSDVRVSLFCIEPEYQNRGIGTEVMHRIVAEADKQGRQVILDVLKGNKASRLYERLGFQKADGEIEVLDYFRRTPGQRTPRPAISGQSPNQLANPK